MGSDLVIDWSEISLHATSKTWAGPTALSNEIGLWSVQCVLMCAWQLRAEGGMSEQGCWAVRWNHNNDLHLSVMGTETHTWTWKIILQNLHQQHSCRFWTVSYFSFKSTEGQVKKIWNSVFSYFQLVLILITLHGTFQVSKKSPQKKNYPFRPGEELQLLPVWQVTILHCYQNVTVVYTQTHWINTLPVVPVH